MDIRRQARKRSQKKLEVDKSYLMKYIKIHEIPKLFLGIDEARMYNPQNNYFLCYSAINQIIEC